MEAIFDSSRHMGTIMWKRTSAHNDSKSWGRVAEYILCYGKRRLNVDDIKVDLDPDYVKDKYRHSDERGRYMDDNLTAKGLSGGGYTYWFHGHESPWRFPQERMLELETDGRIVICTPEGEAVAFLCRGRSGISRRNRVRPLARLGGHQPRELPSAGADAVEDAEAGDTAAPHHPRVIPQSRVRRRWEPRP
ncbi:MAG: hypothetical protein F4X98_07055 [Gammaproteobacteria bacterium]|nr:hypothetical protein [Gammaproteobacteria bacterium]